MARPGYRAVITQAIAPALLRKGFNRLFLDNTAGQVSGALRALRRISAARLLTLATDYTAATDAAGAARSVAQACWAGALPFVSDINLRRVPAVRAHC